MKKILLTVIFAALLTICACSNSTSQPVETISLTEEEVNLLNAIGDDIEVVSESKYAEIVTEMIYHTHSYTGKVIQVEGVFSSNLNGASLPYVYRTLTNNGVETICGLPLLYLDKEIPDNAWIRVTGIVNSGEVNGASATVLEVVAIESLSKEGQKVLEWTGSTHNH